MHKGFFQNELQFSNCLLERSQLENPIHKWLTGLALRIGIVSPCEETTCEILLIGTKALFCVWKHIRHEGIILPTSLTSNFEFYASNYPFVSTLNTN